MQEHELEVKQISTGRLLTISKNYYNSSPEEFEIITGDAGNVDEKKIFVSPTPPPVPATKMTGAPTKNKTSANKMPVPPPSV
jgi:hypothetical protein|tara:strand:+ start:892 stop:1137 length:246 start_codon:yes stop_codon:yes gene_type:complete